MALYQRTIYTTEEIKIPLKAMNYSDRQDKTDHDWDVHATRCFFDCNAFSGRNKLLIMQYKASIGLTGEEFFSAYS